MVAPCACHGGGATKPRYASGTLAQNQIERMRAALRDADRSFFGEACLDEFFREDHDPLFLGRSPASSGRAPARRTARGFPSGELDFELVRRIARRDGRREVRRLALRLENLKIVERAPRDEVARDLERREVLDKLLAKLGA